MSDPEKVFSNEATDTLKQRIGVTAPRSEFPYNEVATKDAIRHFAFGYGDTNPLWIDEAYARKTKYERIVSPPTFVQTMISQRSSLASSGLPGAHALDAGPEYAWYLPIFVGDRIVDEEKLVAFERVHGRFADPMYEQVAEVTFTNQTGAVVGKIRQRCWRFVRQPGGGRDRYADMTVKHYTADELRTVWEGYDTEEIRGCNPRYWEGVLEGDQLTHVVKGPLTVTDMICWKIGKGFSPFTRAHGIRLAYERKHPASAILNSHGIPDVPERVHWEDGLAQTIGIPAAYDFGHQRTTWLAQVITNWMGDDGFLKTLKPRIRRPNIVGDTVWCRGKIVKKYLQDGEHLVDVEVWSDDQRGNRTATATATVALPSNNS